MLLAVLHEFRGVHYQSERTKIRQALEIERPLRPLITAGLAGILALVGFLNQNPERKVAIEGHTDNVGDDDSNQGLSQRRADSVKMFLVQQGIASGRIVSSGKGERQPVADNQSEGGRQQNRRVEVIIDNSAPVVESM